MNNQNNAVLTLVQGTSKSGKQYQGLQFTYSTPYGEYKSPLLFPSPIELKMITTHMQEVAKPANVMAPIYGEQAQ